MSTTATCKPEYQIKELAMIPGDPTDIVVVAVLKGANQLVYCKFPSLLMEGRGLIQYLELRAQVR